MCSKNLLILCFMGDPFLLPASVPNTGGYNVDTRELIDYLLNTDWNCTVVTNTTKYLHDTENKYGQNIRILRIPIDEQHINEQEGLISVFTLTLNSVVTLLQEKNIRPCIIHSFYWFSGYLAATLSKIYNIPFVHTVVSLAQDKISVGVKPRSSYQIEWEHEFLPKAHTIFAITPQEREQLIKHYSISPRRILVVGRCVAREFTELQHNAFGFSTQLADTELNKLKVANNALPVSTLWWNSGAYLYIGRLHENKGIQQIIRAWLRLFNMYGEKVPPLWIVGDTPSSISELRNKILESLPQLDYAEQSYKLVWWGYLSPAGMSTLLLKSMVLIMHSQFEAGGRIVLEAMSSRKPVIATPTGFARDYICDWVNGFLVEYGDIDNLVRRMEHFIKQPLISNAMGSNAYQVFSKLENHWDCYRNQVRIYEFAIKEPEEAIPDNMNALPKAFEITDYMQRGLLTTYPYHTPDSKFVTKLLCSEIPASYTFFDAGSHSIMGKAICNDACYRVKLFYSAMNDSALWAGEHVTCVMLASERYKRATLSSQIDGIIPILHNISSVYAIYMPECIEFAPAKTDLEIVLQALRRVTESRVPDVIPNYSIRQTKECTYLADRWNALEYDATHSFCKTWSSFWTQIRPEIMRVRTMSFQKCNYVINYGASVLKHLCIDQANTVSFFPSDEIFMGEIGFDYARLWLEWEWGNDALSVSESDENYRLIQQYSKLSDEHFRSWCMYMLCLAIQRSLKLATSENKRLFSLLERLLRFRVTCSEDN